MIHIAYFAAKCNKNIFNPYIGDKKIDLSPILQASLIKF
jgi:hypothetical protein